MPGINSCCRCTARKLELERSGFHIGLFRYAENCRAHNFMKQIRIGNARRRSLRRWAECNTADTMLIGVQRNGKSLSGWWHHW